MNYLLPLTLMVVDLTWLEQADFVETESLLSDGKDDQDEPCHPYDCLFNKNTLEDSK